MSWQGFVRTSVLVVATLAAGSAGAASFDCSKAARLLGWVHADVG